MNPALETVNCFVEIICLSVGCKIFVADGSVSVELYRPSD